MSEYLYVAQAILIAGVAMTLVWHRHPIMKAQIALWCLGVSAIACYFGLTEQLEFYSNDQRQYSQIVARIAAFDLSPDLDSWLTGWRIPFTIPASVLAAIGIEPSLALKAVALGYLTCLTHVVIHNLESSEARTGLKNFYLTGCLGVGGFFSLFALRETAMMFFVLKFLLGRTAIARLISVLFLYQLRPHLAASLIVGLVVGEFVSRMLPIERFPYLRSLADIILATFTGQLLYSIGLAQATGTLEVVSRRWGVSDTVRIISNFVGLQFLTADSDTVAFDISFLLLSRLVLSETILIPTFFIWVIFTRSPQLNLKARSVLIAFTVYVTIATNTDFNSFRQNIPFIPLMGLIIVGTRTFRVQSVDSAKRQIPAR